MGRTKTKRRKQVRKEDSIRIRVTDEQKRLLTEAAERHGLGVSTWLLSLGMQAAQGSKDVD